LAAIKAAAHREQRTLVLPLQCRTADGARDTWRITQLGAVSTGGPLRERAKREGDDRRVHKIKGARLKKTLEIRHGWDVLIAVVVVAFSNDQSQRRRAIARSTSRISGCEGGRNPEPGQDHTRKSGRFY